MTIVIFLTTGKNNSTSTCSPSSPVSQGFKRNGNGEPTAETVANPVTLSRRIIIPITVLNKKKPLKQPYTQNVQIYARDSYEDVLSKISELNLIAVSCPEHSDVLPFLIMEYVQIRFHFEAKRFRNDNFSKANTSVHSFLKQAKNA